MQLLKIIGLLFFLKITNADDESKYNKYGPNLYTFYACNYQIISTATFCAVPGFGCYCNTTGAMSTLAGCLHYKNRDTTSLKKYLIHMCESEFNVTINSDDLENAYNNYQTSARNSSEIQGFNATIPVDYPVLLEESSMELYYAAYIQFLGNYDDSLYFGSGVLGYWLFVMLIATVANLATYLFPGLLKSCTGPISNTWRKWVTLPATSNRNKSEHHTFLGIHWLIPSRFESIVLTGFIAVVIFGCSYKIKFVKGDPIFESKSQALLRYTADRTGIVATIFIPLLILFAGRNNFLQWLTGWNFATFITYHKWIGRIAFILVMIHSICFSFTFGKKYYKEDIAETYVIWGVIATVAGGLIMGQGMLYFRRNWYEIFLIIHIILAALFIGGGWIHVADLGYVWFFYSAVAVWVFDRVVRIARLCLFGFPKAQVLLLADETLKVVVPKPSYWKAVPGGHAFIHFLRPTCFWQSHPFTFTEHLEMKDKIILYCKVKGGVTHGLYQYLMTYPGRTTDIRVAVEGPYGEPTPARKYDSGIFVAGGNGIPGIYSEVFDLSQRDIKQSLKLFWVVRDYKSLLWFYEELLALKTTKISTTIYLTRPDTDEILQDFENRLPFGVAALEEDEDQDEKNDKSDSIKEKSESLEEGSVMKRSRGNSREDAIAIIKKELSHITFVEKRPSMDDLVIRESEESLGSTAFVACGHPIMVDDLRLAVRKNLDKSKIRIDFYEQLQVWA